MIHLQALFVFDPEKFGEGVEGWGEELEEGLKLGLQFPRLIRN